MTNRVRIGATLAAGTLLLFGLFHRLRHDDAFITLQFARNVATGAGFVFNPGAPILGTTSPLSALVLAALYPLVGNALPSAAVGLGALALTAQSLLLYRLMERGFGPGAGLAGGLCWLGLAGGQSWLALETNLVAALALGTFVCLDGERDVRAGLCMGLAFLTRYDAGVLIPIVIAGEWLRRRRLPWRTLGVAGVTVVPWLLWATSYFGSFLPNTFFAKQRLTEPIPYALHYLDLFLGQPWQALGLPGQLGVVTPLLWIAGTIRLWRSRESRVVEAVIYGLLLFAAYIRIGPPAGHHWHLYPSSLAFGLLAIIGGGSIAVAAGRRLVAESRTAGHIAIAAAALVTMLAAARTVAAARALPDEFWFGWRDRTYSEIASWAREHARPGASFLAVEFGTIGWLSGLRMIDACGLINPTNEFPRTQSLESYIALVLRFEPDLVLAHNELDARRIAAKTGYQIVKRFEWKQPWSVVLARSGEVIGDSIAQ